MRACLHVSCPCVSPSQAPHRVGRIASQRRRRRLRWACCGRHAYLSCASDTLTGILQALENTIGTFADEGLRTIAVAYRDCDTAPDMEDGDAVEQNLTLIALLGLEDPVRPEVCVPIAGAHKHVDVGLSAS